MAPVDIMFLAASITALLLQPAEPPPKAHRACDLVLDVAAGDTRAVDAMAELEEIGNEAIPAINEVLGEDTLPTAVVEPLLDFVARHGDSRSHDEIRHWIFSGDPQLAALAARALYLSCGQRAVPTLEFVLRTQPPFATAHAALEGLEGRAFRSSFETLTSFVESEDNDPQLRAQAAEMLPALNQKETKRWLKRLALPATTSPFLRAELEALATSIQGKRRR